jgi:hypothetical protein
MAHHLAAVVASEPELTPPFGAVAPLGDGYVVLLHGPVSAEISSPLGVVRLSGEQAVTWVDHKVEVPVDRLSVTYRDHPVEVDPMSDLRAGLVPGSGFVVTTGKTAGAAAMAASAGPRAQTRQAQTRQGQTGPAQTSPAQTSPGQRPARSTEALGEPVGQLVGTDGLRIPLDRAYVLGREPESDPAVKSGSATPVRLSDDENLISRVHSYVTVEAGQVYVQDAASANGTFVAASGDEEWARIGDDPVELPPTWSMRVGNQIFTHVAAAATP